MEKIKSIRISFLRIALYPKKGKNIIPFILNMKAIQNADIHKTNAVPNKAIEFFFILYHYFKVFMSIRLRFYLKKKLSCKKERQIRKLAIYPIIKIFHNSIR
jgi:hypothetical protein